LFERFFRGERARRAYQGGSGLGLSIARWIVDAHKGRIEVQSQVGEGTTFTVKLPLVV
jgi:signal transduction histidine kinase